MKPSVLRRNTRAPERRELRFLAWPKQRAIAYPYCVCAPDNDNWIPFSSTLTRATLARLSAKRADRRKP